jgi:hypothetical protein
MDALEVVNRRLRAQRLAGEPLGSPAEVVRRFGAVQAQEYGEAIWSLAQRSGHPGAAAVEEAFAAGAFLRTHVMRPTWHFVAPEDLGWLLALTGPRLIRGDAGRLRRLGVTDATIERAGEIVAAALSGEGTLTRSELRARLAAEGVETDSSQAGHLLFGLELRGLVCSGPPRGAKQTYALVADRVTDSRDLEGEEAVAELVRRYLGSHGPATAADFAWWSGLTLTKARRGIELCGGAFEAVEDADGRVWHLDPAASEPLPAKGALMLGSFDEAMVAFRELRSVSVSGEAGRTLIVRPVLVGGRLAGTWRRTLDDGAVRVDLTLAATGGDAQEAALAAEAERYARHLDRRADVALAEGELSAAA